MSKLNIIIFFIRFHFSYSYLHVICYIYSAHWMLAAINPRDDTVYWLDSLLGSVRMEFKEVIEM